MGHAARQTKMSRTFANVDDRDLREVIAQARQRLVFVSPGIRPSGQQPVP